MSSLHCFHTCTCHTGFHTGPRSRILILYNTVYIDLILYNTVYIDCSIYTVLQYTVLCCTVLYCSVVYCTVLLQYSTV